MKLAQLSYLGFIQPCLLYSIWIILCSSFVSGLPKQPISVDLSHFPSLPMMEKMVWEFSGFLAAPLLVDDVDGDGELELLFATVDGHLHCLTLSRSVMDVNSLSSRWSAHFHNHQFVSGATLVPVEVTSHKLILFVSAGGTLLLFDNSGNLVAQIQIPPVLLDQSAKFDHDPSHLATMVTWDLNADNTNTHTKIYRLKPRVYTAPVVLTAAAHRFPLHPESAEVSVVVPVSFETIETGLVLSALVGFSQRSLLSAGIWGSTQPSQHNMPVLVPLRLGKMNESSPYPLASPLVVSLSQPSDILYSRFQHPGFYLLITLFSGHLYRVSLPLDPNLLRTELLWSDTDDGTGFPHTCKLVAYTPPSSGSRLGCLLLDNASNLRLIDVSSAHDHGVPHKAGRLVWDYRPASVSLGSHEPNAGQLTEVTIVPADSCDNDTVNPCDFWAVYPAPDGRIHAVDIQSGRSVPPFPVQINHFENNTLNFASGPGILYKSADGTAWLLFSDTSGCLYYLHLKRPRSVVRANHTYCAMNYTVFDPTHWLSPIPFPQQYLQQTARPHITHSDILALIVPSNGRITVLSSTTQPSSSVRRMKFPHYLKKHGLLDVSFIDHRDHPLSEIHLHSGQQLIHYKIRDCPPPANFMVQLLNPVGLPISEWSRPMCTPSVSNKWITCRGTFYALSLGGTAFRSLVSLHVIELTTGNLIHPLYQLDPQQEIATSLVLEFHTFWRQILLIWTYSLFLSGVLALGLASYRLNRDGRAHAV